MKVVTIILLISKNEAKALAKLGLKYHTDIFTGKWKRRRYYLKDDLEGRNVRMLVKLREPVK